MEAQNALRHKYTPINGDFYDKLEVAAIHNLRCELIYLDQDGNEVNIISKIEDLYTQNRVEYAVLEGITIRLDQIKALNGEREEDFERRVRSEKSDFAHRFYAAEEEVLIDENEFYTFTVLKTRNILELKVHKYWDRMEDIPDLKTQLITVADFMKERFGLLNDFTELIPDEEGTLVAPFIPARGILMNSGLYKVADLLPLSCNTLVHDRGSFSVNSIRNRSFKDRYFAENWLAER